MNTGLINSKLVITVSVFVLSYFYFCSQLKAEIQRLRKRGIIKQGSLDPTRNCARCLTELGRIINRGAVCSICRKKVCKTCRHYSEDGQQWVCLVCHKQM